MYYVKNFVKKHPSLGAAKADNRTRTDDLRITNALLYQLSHIGVYLSVLDYYTQFPAECKRKIYFLLQVPLTL